jgi:hypothetical protein
MHRRYLVRIRIAPLSFGGSVLVVFEEVTFSGTALVLPEGNVGSERSIKHEHQINRQN